MHYSRRHQTQVIVGIWFVLGTAPSHASMTKDGKMRQENVLGKIQLFEWCYEMALVLRRAAWLCE